MSNEDIIKLNMGGSHFCISKETLKQGTFFKNLLEKGNKEEEIHIDPSPELFEEILGFLRSCEILMDDKTDLLEPRQEAIFYGFQDMIKSIDHAIDNLLSEQQKIFVVMDMRQFTDLSIWTRHPRVMLLI
ncbi:uncharacterized protein B0P05DRAFT_556483 [Gilbertella persicaria]|uniref:uncharacterized protein n=1 Tax=Gilbertella persicaria TaxID=101096 RepID=UPI0022211450|nr:uncharacterized protein B0P05DRAFT_556483 [Gilbertella persicaria]KAI8062303.1 hypothetical protein B0P05DRAFT_556483 [Gilbertella persicaria]